MRVIIDCLMFTALQIVAHKAHEESSSDLSAISDVNRGNFLELLHMRSIDIPQLSETLKEKLKSISQWTSAVKQFELLEIMSDFVLQGILSDVRDSCDFGIIIDETSDITRNEQVYICLSYVWMGRKEAFVGFFDTKSTDGQSLYELMEKVMGEMNLALHNIVGTCFRRRIQYERDTQMACYFDEGYIPIHTLHSLLWSPVEFGSSGYYGGD